MNKIYILISNDNKDGATNIISAFADKKDAQKSLLIRKSQGDYSKTYSIKEIDFLPKNKMK